KYVLSSDESLEMEALPSSIIIVGGGVIGIEWASMLADFGVNVTVVEYLDHILPTEDLDVSKEVERLLKRKGITFVNGAKVLPKTISIVSGVTVDVDIRGEKKTYEVDVMLVLNVIVDNTIIIGLESTDIVVENGVVKINELYF